MKVEMTTTSVTEPLISVVIPTFRRGELVQRAVQSVLRQTYACFEVIVVIDGVDDGTRARIDHLGDARTHVLETGRNQGPAEARNHGVRAWPLPPAAPS